MGASADEIARLASERAGVKHQAPQDQSWRPGLELFLADLDRSRTLLPGMRPGIERFAQATLEARLAIDEWLDAHPEAAAAPVARPTVIIGMPRAGTTLLLNMLRFDPQRRVLWHWEGNRELPPVETARLHDDPRIARRVREVEQALASGALPPNHHVEMGDEPTECIWPLGQDFKAYPWLVQTEAPAYFEWLMEEADMVAAYRHHRRVLQVLQSAAPGVWTLKLPSHAMAVEALLSVYPDANVVMTHRDPVKPVASSCSLVDKILSNQNAGCDPKLIGYQTLKLNALGARRMQAARDARPALPVLDIHYKTFVRDPMATVRKLYAFEGLKLNAAVAARMQAELDRHNAQRTVAGEHRYHLDDYGLSLEGLDRAFGDYVERYGIELER